MKKRIPIFIKISIILAFFAIWMINTNCSSCEDDPAPPPQVLEAPTLTQPENNGEFANDETIVFAWTAVENAIEYHIFIDGIEQTLDPVDALTFNGGTYEIGSHVWYVEAWGPVNKETSEIWNFTIFDNVPPVVEITDTTPNSTIVVNEVPALDGLPLPDGDWTFGIEGTASDEHSGLSLLEIWIDGFAEQTTYTEELDVNSHNFTYTFRSDDTAGEMSLNELLPSGTHTVRVRVLDERENEATAYTTFILDKADPEIEITSPVPGIGGGTEPDIWGNNELEICVDAEDMSGVAEIRLAVENAAEPGDWTLDSLYDVTFPAETTCMTLPTDLSGLQDGENYIRARVEDGFGNFGYSDTTLRVDRDITGPTYYEGTYDISVIRDGLDVEAGAGGDDIPHQRELWDYTAEIDVRESLDITIWFEEAGSGFDEGQVLINVINDPDDDVIETEEYTASAEMSPGLVDGNYYQYTYHLQIYDFPTGSGNYIPDGQYVITIVAIDSAGNESTPGFSDIVPYNRTEFEVTTLIYRDFEITDPWDGETGITNGDVRFQWTDIGREMDDLDSNLYHDMDGNNVNGLPNEDFFEIQISTERHETFEDDIEIFEQNILYSITEISQDTIDFYTNTDGGVELEAGVYYGRIKMYYGTYEKFTDIHEFAVGETDIPTYDTAPNWGEYYVDSGVANHELPIDFEWHYGGTESPITFYAELGKLSKEGDWTYVEVISGLDTTTYQFTSTELATYGYGQYNFRVRSYYSGAADGLYYSGWAGRWFVVTPYDSYIDPPTSILDHDPELFNNPSEIEIDNDGNIYIMDSFDRIMVYSSSGDFIARVGGNLTSPVGFTVDADKNIYIADDAGVDDLIHVFEYDTDTDTWAYDEDWEDTFSNIKDIGRMGALMFVAHGSIVSLYDTSGNAYPDAGSQYEFTGASDPTDLASNNTYMYVLDSSGTIYRVNNQGSSDTNWSVSGAGGIGANNANIYVCDGANINSYDEDGVADTSVTFAPTTPYDIVATPTDVFVISQGADNVQSYSATTGNANTDFSTDGIMGEAATEAVDTNVYSPGMVDYNQDTGYYYVLDSGSNRLMMFNNSGVFQAAVSSYGGIALNNPTGLAVVNNGSSYYNGVYVTDTDNHRIVRYALLLGSETGTIGEEGTDLGQFDTPLGISVSDTRPETNRMDEGNIYVADSANNRIVVLHVDGTNAFYVISILDSVGGQTFSLPSSIYAYYGRLYISDSTDALFFVRRQYNNYYFVFSMSGIGSNLTPYVDTHGVLYATCNHKVMKFAYSYNPYWIGDADYVYGIPADNTAFFGGDTAGSDLGQYSSPTGMSILWNNDGSASDIMINDQGNNRIITTSLE